MSCVFSTWRWITCPCSPDAADSSSFDVQLGDIILTATDGLFDNMPDYMILQELKKLKVCGGVVQTACRFNVHTKLIGSSCFYCRFEEHKLREHPADCPEHRRAGPRPGLRPQLHVSLCTVRLRQWAECKRWASPLSWTWRQMSLCHRRCWVSACHVTCEVFLQQETT